MLFELMVKAGLGPRELSKQMCGDATDKFLDLLLKGMSMAFSLSSSYRNNIEDFKGKYLFRTKDNQVAESIIFEYGEMRVKDDAINDWDVCITFKNAAALRDFLFSKNQDILNSLLKNEVEVDGNQNYIYRFGFMARDLGKRLGVV